MHLDFAIWLNQTLDKLQDPTRSIAYICLLIGSPLVLISLIWLSNKIESKKEN